MINSKPAAFLKLSIVVLAVMCAFFPLSAQDTDTTAAEQDTAQQQADTTRRIIEDATLEKTRAVRLTVAGFGPAGFANVGESNLSYDFFGGLLWEVNPQAAIKAIGDITTDFSNVTMITANVGANFYPIVENISPVFGAMFGFGYAFGTSHEFGFDVGVSGGVILFRTATTQMTVEGHGIFLLSEMEDGFPTKFGGRLGIIF
ncbi:MAG: hypothetical protein ACLFSB_00175 [Chitinispirillaceae bacterium]